MGQEGLEPSRPKTQVPKTCAAASYATSPLAESGGFEPPTSNEPVPTFQAGALSLSATIPFEGERAAATPRRTRDDARDSNRGLLSLGGWGGT